MTGHTCIFYWECEVSNYFHLIFKSENFGQPLSQNDAIVLKLEQCDFTIQLWIQELQTGWQEVQTQGRSRGGSVGLLEPRFWQELFQFHGDLGENLEIHVFFA